MKNNLIFVALTCLWITGCGQKLEKDVVGKWAWEFSFPVEESNASGQAYVNCTSEFFANKGVNHDCAIKMSIDLKEENVRANFNGKIRATGEWNVNGQTLLDKTIDGKLEMTDAKVNGEALEEDALAEFSKTFQEKIIVKGETTAYITRSFDAKTWVFDQEVDKKKITVTAVRQ